MPIGLLSNCGAVFVGGLIGTACGKYLTDRMKEVITVVFGLSAVANGIVSIIKVESMPPVIMAMIVGTFFGELFQLERRVRSGLHGALERVPISTDRIDMDEYVTIVAIFCASGFGIYGVLMEGMSGESSILLSKAVMDLFTALIFAGRSARLCGEPGGSAPADCVSDCLRTFKAGGSPDHPGAVK